MKDNYTKVEYINSNHILSGISLYIYPNDSAIPCIRKSDGVVGIYDTNKNEFKTIKLNYLICGT